MRFTVTIPKSNQDNTGVNTEHFESHEWNTMGLMSRRDRKIFEEVRFQSFNQAVGLEDDPRDGSYIEEEA